MSKKTEKILLGIGLGILGIFGIVKLVKAYKKGIEEIEEQEFQETEDLEKAGVNTSKLREEVKNEETDFTRMLFTACRFNSELDENLFDIDDIIENLDSKVIHVRQRFDTKSKHNESKRRLDFMIDIPDYTTESFRGPKIGNFLTTFKETAIYMSDNIVKFSSPATRKLVGFVVISRERNSKSIIEYRELKPEVYKDFADEEHDGLTKFYEIEKKRLNTTGPKDYVKENAGWLFENYPDLSESDSTLYVENIVLEYIISFPIRSNKPGELYGIDTKSGVECIKYLTENLVVGREDSRYKITYRNLMFNAPNSEGEPDLSWYYTVDEDTNKVTIDNIVFED